MNLRTPVILVASLASLAALAEDGAGVYRWTDASGEEHYTNDLASLPGDTVVTPVAHEDESLLEHAEPMRGPAAVAMAEPTREQLEYEKLKEEVARARLETKRSELALRRGELEAEHYWRGTFRRLRRSLISLQDALERERSVLTLDGLPVTGSYQVYGPNCMMLPHQCAWVHPEQARVRARQLEREIARVEEDLADLERRASFESVPHAWRK